MPSQSACSTTASVNARPNWMTLRRCQPEAAAAYSAAAAMPAKAMCPAGLSTPRSTSRSTVSLTLPLCSRVTNA
jgi:hypothetical protein